MNRNGRTTNDPKEKTIKFRCNENLYADIEKISKRKNLTVSSYIRNALIEQNKKYL